MSIVQIRLLGGLTLTYGDTPLPSIPAAARSLFAYLVIYHDRSHTRDLLAGTFWADLPDEDARRRLRQALWQIRRSLRPAQDKTRAPFQILLTEGNTVQLHRELPVWIDVVEFERMGASTRPDELALAADLYCGDLLEGYYDDWLLVERERLQRRFSNVLERLVEGFKALGEYEEALDYARRLVAKDPLREDAHAEVMRLCHLLGRDSEALQQYARCRQTLASELDIEPSGTITALADEIATQSQALEIPHLPVASRSSPLSLLDRPDRIPLVGRGVERAELAYHLERAAIGQGGMLLLMGAAGVGKTRLMQEVARDAVWRGHTVLWGHSCELAALAPYQPLVEILHVADLSNLPAVWRGELARLLPEFGPLPPTLEPQQERVRLLEALAQAFLALTQVAPHLVILEDVHWMDPASFEALRVLLPRLPDSQLLVVGTLRPEELGSQLTAHQGLATLEATRIPRRIELKPLTEAESDALIQRVLELEEPAPSFGRQVYTQTEGNPFFVTEALRVLIDEGQVYRDETGRWRTRWDQATGESAEIPVPPSVALSIGQRLARLTPDTQELLGVAAVIGRRVEFDLWVSASGCDEGTVLAAAEELERRGLLIEMEDVIGYRFAHETIRQVIYDSMSPARRRWCHRRAAEALEVMHPDQVEALARHHGQGQQWNQAAHYALRAGEHAQAVYAHQQALDYFAQADAWLVEGRVALPTEEITRQRADLAERRGRVYNFLAEYSAAESHFNQARQMWADLGDWRGVARVLNRLSFAHFLQYDYRSASHYAELALATLPESDPPAELLAASLTYLGLSAWTEGRYDDALPPLQQALSLLELGTDQYGLARCLNSLGLVHLDRGEFKLAAPCFTRSLALRQQIADRRGEAWCWHNLGRMALNEGDLATAREKLEQARSIFVEIQHPDGLETTARTVAKLARVEAAGLAGGRISVRLPGAAAPLGRPLSDDEMVTVNWTLDTAADAAIPDKAERRRHRLLRLLTEAQNQGALPAYRHLAEALGISERTVQRDMSILLQEHPHLPPTRRKMSE